MTDREKGDAGKQDAYDQQTYKSAPGKTDNDRSKHDVHPFLRTVLPNEIAPGHPWDILECTPMLFVCQRRVSHDRAAAQSSDSFPRTKTDPPSPLLKSARTARPPSTPLMCAISARTHAPAFSRSVR